MTTQTAADPRDEIIETQKRVITFEREKNQRLQSKLQWYEDIHRKKELPQNARLAAIALKKLSETSTPDKDDWIRADLGTMATATGVSNSTSSRGVHCLAEKTDAIELRVEKHPYDPQQEILYFRTRESFESPPEITITGEIKRHGGARDRCHCGGELVEKQRTLRRQRYLQCDKCHAIARIFQPENTENKEWPATGFQDEMVDESPNQDVPFQDETVVDASEGDVYPLQDAHRNTTQVPLADCAASLLSPSDIERDAAQLLLEIAGTAPQHVEMCKQGDTKYITVHRAPHQGDMLAHLRGYQMKGATLRHPFNLTRAICDDADTPEDWQRLKAAARLLVAAADFKVILEPSPAIGDHVGGGHLWIIFDRLVDAYSARQTMLQYAPRLAESKEYWPREGNNRVRLPGGKYVRPGIAAWCLLQDAQGNELSHDGAGAARVLLEHQTPADRVNAYEKPALVLEMQSERRPSPAQAGYLQKNEAKQIIADFNASHRWSEIAALCGGFNRRGKFLATWRGDKKPDVAINPRTDLAKDFARTDEPAMDKYEVWCRIQGGASWEAFKTCDLAERCKQMRQLERKAS
jgi:hypothetical protein